MIASISAIRRGPGPGFVPMHTDYSHVPEPYPKETDVQMLHRNPPRLGEMLGEDDWIDKMSANGRDYGRFAYMARLLKFTEAKRREILGVEAQVAGQDLAALVM